MSNILHQAWNEFRVAPLGYSFIGHGVAAATGMIGLDLMNIASSEPISIVHVGAGVITIGAAALEASMGRSLVKRQHALKERLERVVQRYGYRDSIFERTTKEWCNRQTARVVCEASGVLPQYQLLCDNSNDTAELRYLPHF